MTTPIHVHDMLPAYALGALEENERVMVARHLKICAACRHELHTYEQVTASLAAITPLQQPPQGLKEQILAKAQQTRQAPAQPIHRSAPGSIPSRASLFNQVQALFRSPLRAWAAVSVVLVAILIFTNLSLWAQVHALQQNQAGDFRTVALTAPDVNAAASGVLIISHDGMYGTLVVDDLAPLLKEQQYQLWLIRNGNRTSGGVFDVGKDGYAALEIYAPEPLVGYDSFGITIEPAGGSPAPTGTRVLGGEL